MHEFQLEDFQFWTMTFFWKVYSLKAFLVAAADGLNQATPLPGVSPRWSPRDAQTGFGSQDRLYMDDSYSP